MTRRSPFTLSLSALITTVLVVMSAAPATAGHEQDNHWSRGGGRADVYIVDHTPARWPVGTMVNEWNAQSNDAQLQLYYRLPGNCPDPDRCIPVKEMTSTTEPTGCDGLGGCTLEYFFNPNLVDHYVETRVFLNRTTVPNTSHYNRLYACHELGHAIGLGDRGGLNSSSTSCLDEQPDPGSGEIPDAHDGNVLFDTYNHES